MKGLLIFVGVLLFGWSTAQAGEPAKYRASITNLTAGQVMTPPLWVVHQASFSLFTLGAEASEGLKTQSKDGDPSGLVGEVSGHSAVGSFAIGDGVDPVTLPSDAVFPGESREVILTGSPTDFLSVSSMLASTNDAFVSYRGLALNLAMGEKQIIFLNVYDSGAETNNELCANIPGPPCGNAHSDTAGNEGFVHFHPGLTYQGDLDPGHAFAAIAAKVTIERIK